KDPDRSGKRKRERGGSSGRPHTSAGPGGARPHTSAEPRKSAPEPTGGAWRPGTAATGGPADDASEHDHGHDNGHADCGAVGRRACARLGGGARADRGAEPEKQPLDARGREGMTPAEDGGEPLSEIRPHLVSLSAIRHSPFAARRSPAYLSAARHPPLPCTWHLHPDCTLSKLIKDLALSLSLSHIHASTHPFLLEYSDIAIAPGLFPSPIRRGLTRSSRTLNQERVDVRVARTASYFILITPWPSAPCTAAPHHSASIPGICTRARSVCPDFRGNPAIARVGVEIRRVRRRTPLTVLSTHLKIRIMTIDVGVGVGVGKFDESFKFGRGVSLHL
ncbi:hypothetical protein EVG20_g3361, partial [Dentipellis fragilis]